jgi:hypothetical protein
MVPRSVGTEEHQAGDKSHRELSARYSVPRKEAGNEARRGGAEDAGSRFLDGKPADRDGSQICAKKHDKPNRAPQQVATEIP